MKSEQRNYKRGKQQDRNGTREIRGIGKGLEVKARMGLNDSKPNPRDQVIIMQLWFSLRTEPF